MTIKLPKRHSTKAVSLTFRIPETTSIFLATEAAMLGVGRSELMRQIIENYIENN